VAQYVGGYRLLDSGAYEPRPVHILRGKSRKEYDVRVRMLKGAAGHVEEDPVWSPIVHECREIARRNRSTLVFANSRRVAENMTWKMNDGLEELLAYAHHGSLSREIRAEVERRLKAGELRAIVATSSLEMGIDIGSLDEVVLVQSPPRISAAIQRVGRAGHQSAGPPSSPPTPTTCWKRLCSRAAFSTKTSSRSVPFAGPWMCSPRCSSP